MSINLRALKDVDEDAEIVRNEIASLDTEIKESQSRQFLIRSMEKSKTVLILEKFSTTDAGNWSKND